MLVLLALRRYSTKKDGRDRDMEDNASHFSLSEIWDERALEDLETAESFEAFKASQPVIRSKSPTNNPRLLQQREGLSTVAMKSAVVGSVLRLVRREDDLDYDSVGSNISDPSQLLGIEKSPAPENGLSEERFVDALSFIPLALSDSTAQFTPKSKKQDDVFVPLRIINETADIGDISLLKSSSSVSDIDESDSSTGKS
jgi:hypothetical protein